MKSIVMWSIIPILFLILGILSYYNDTSIHYVGETTITPEQVVKLAVLESDEAGDSEFPFNYIQIQEDGTLKYIYDYFTIGSYDFLQKKERTLNDNYVWYFLRKTFFKPRILITFAVCLVASVFLIYWTGKKRGNLIHIIEKLNHFIESKLDSQYPLVNSANIVSKPADISLNGNKGIISVRSWKFDRKGNLKSIVKGTKWDKHELCAEKQPDKDGSDGIYAYRLGANLKQRANIMGIVELDGKYEYHPDGVIRAEHCKILGLFVSKGYQRAGRFISCKYSLPVYFDNSPEEGYLHWLYSESGQKGLQHNYELLKEGNYGDGNNA